MESLRLKRVDWLRDMGVEEKHVLHDGEREFVVTEDEGEYGDDYQVDFKRTYLPSEIQNIYNPF